jgi:hypothetical protein
MDVSQCVESNPQLHQVANTVHLHLNMLTSRVPAKLQSNSEIVVC